MTSRRALESSEKPKLNPRKGAQPVMAYVNNKLVLFVGDIDPTWRDGHSLSERKKLVIQLLEANNLDQLMDYETAFTEASTVLSIWEAYGWKDWEAKEKREEGGKIQVVDDSNPSERFRRPVEQGIDELETSLLEGGGSWSPAKGALFLLLSGTGNPAPHLYNWMARGLLLGGSGSRGWGEGWPDLCWA